MNNRMSNTNILMTHIMPGRGCPFPCRFCASSQTQVQYRSGNNIRHELIHLIENYKIEGFSVVGNDFILNKGNVQDICDSIKDLNLSWSTLSRVDRVDPDILLRMKNSGCYELDLGVETGSQKILDAMKKKIDVSQIKKSLKMTHETGIKNKIFLIHGFPGENHETTMETINLLENVGHLIDRISLFRFVPLPGTYVYNNPNEYNLRGTLNSPNWDGDWGKFHIHHNHYHWWGNDNNFKVTNDSYEMLNKYIESKWPPKYEI
ncbi:MULTISPECIES: radical SAM protein [unclassified Flavobacterium]|uniref:B12-binding domain-containing radical SAM protein n=1 Tax=unclassified Flavobacterium TaxID=196869 RepID=UPI0009F88540|nr:MULTISPECIES: radical SAM protein [unclassified Flavobacterium]